MDIAMLAEIEKAINKVVEKHCEEPLWDGCIHPKLIRQMTKAAAMIFDASMDGQEYAERERG